MKIVINGCFGGFGLSIEAASRYYERKGVPVFYIFRKYNKEKPRLISKEEALKSKTPYCIGLASTPEFNDMGWPLHYLTTSPDDRTDPDLVAVVEELGHKADGEHADLRVVEIPDGVSWGIDEYDGVETIHETHRSWG